MMQYAASAWIDKEDTPKPRLISQLAGGFNFGECKHVKEMWNDSQTPFLFHGEAPSRGHGSGVLAMTSTSHRKALSLVRDPKSGVGAQL